MEKYGLFNSISGDRKYTAEDFAAYFGTFMGNGVFLHEATALVVSVNTGRTVRVAPGKAYISGYWYNNTANLDKTLEAAVANRIDRLAVRLDLTERTMTIVVKEGTPASSPVAPALIRTADIWELGIADVYLAAGVTELVSGNITDLRNDGNLCGGVTMLVDRAETIDDISQAVATFSDASTRANILTTDRLNTIFGKIKKFFSDLKPHSFNDLASVLGTETNKAPENKLLFEELIALPKPNCLSNASFTINTRGAASYNTSGMECLDSWIITAAFCTVNQTTYGVAITNTHGSTSTVRGIKQDLTDLKGLAGKTVTFSVCGYCEAGGRLKIRYLANGSNIGEADTYSTTETIVKATATLPSPLTSIQVNVYSENFGTTVHVAYAKLELGSYTTAYSPQLLGEELARCKRLFDILNISKIYPINEAVASNDRVMGELLQYQKFAEKANITDIQDNLTTQIAGKPLDAKQGYLIDQRLTALGFRQGSATLTTGTANGGNDYYYQWTDVSGTWRVDFSINSNGLLRQGNYVLMTLEVQVFALKLNGSTLSFKNASAIKFSFPTNFIPKENFTKRVGCKFRNSGLHDAATVTYNKSANQLSLTSPDTTPSNYNEGPILYIDIGYEADPITT